MVTYLKIGNGEGECGANKTLYNDSLYYLATQIAEHFNISAQSYWKDGVLINREKLFLYWGSDADYFEYHIGQDYDDVALNILRNASAESVDTMLNQFAITYDAIYGEYKYVLDNALMSDEQYVEDTLALINLAHEAVEDGLLAYYYQEEFDINLPDFYKHAIETIFELNLLANDETKLQILNTVLTKLGYAEMESVTSWANEEAAFISVVDPTLELLVDLDIATYKKVVSFVKNQEYNDKELLTTEITNTRFYKDLDIYIAEKTKKEEEQKEKEENEKDKKILFIIIGSVIGVGAITLIVLNIIANKKKNEL